MGVRSTLFWLALPLLAGAARAQDLRRVQSPNSQLEFRLFVSQPEPGNLFRLGYQVQYRGKPLLDTSYFGLNLHNQEPVLGENVGLISSKVTQQSGSRTMVAEYMQNGSLGRLLTIEIRIWDEGVAFRYLVPRTSPVEQILLDDEITEFHLANPPEQMGPINSMPLVLPQPGVGFIGIAEAGAPDYPRSRLAAGTSILVTKLAKRFEGTTPLTGPWRIVTVGADRDSVLQSAQVRELSR
ncbi:MAG: glycoside hydrolase family 97 N-terminal domain-containing protein [Candidatus Solibacter sp.]